VLGFFVHVADVTLLKQRELELIQAVTQRDQALAEVRSLRGILSVCSSCNGIRAEDGQWVRLDRYVSERTEARFSHGLCPACAERLYPEFA
jgi:hypothetical protein